MTGVFPRDQDDTGAPGGHPAPSPAVRASDTEREGVVRVLTEACAEGRLTLEELGGRVGAAYGAVTRAELEPLTIDLPVAAPVPQGQPTVPAAMPVPAARRKWLVAVMSEHKHTGHWRLGQRTVGVTVMGEMALDLRNAVIESPDLHLSLYVVMGELKVIVPAGVEVEVSGFVFMGERKVRVDATRPRPGVPRLHIRVRGMMGEAKIETA